MEGLVGHARPLAQHFEQGAGNRVRGVLLVGAVLDHDPLVQIGTVGGVALIRLVGMDAVGVVRRHHKAGGDGRQIVLLRAPQPVIDSTQNVL